MISKPYSQRRIRKHFRKGWGKSEETHAFWANCHGALAVVPFSILGLPNSNLHLQRSSSGARRQEVLHSSIASPSLNTFFAS